MPRSPVLRSSATAEDGEERVPTLRGGEHGARSVVFGQGMPKGPERFNKYLSSGFRTPTGKVELLLSQADKFRVSPLPEFNGLPENPDPDFPLVLTSCKSRYYLHSSYLWIERLRRHRPHPKTEIHPETAARYGIHDGDTIIIETRKGVMSQVAHITDKVHPGVINSAYGWWFP